ncbi:flagellar hook-associated protein FlgK [Aestuariispira insulae]|uniref:Flagellar hook-associated protein 1 n=1 Tax=Aestuariispira insulae TaxID=1461337 RepID=A0A3D9H5M7_9PROT|nr:flagellar hook-associated protein FlgK [Aestuariispira insulae]RED44807.1 flagellar hook-associated protein 1 FlgK [Aestuariispira insulae]
MSLSISLNASLTAMMTAQYNIAVSSANIANADTDGYTTKSAQNQAQIIGGKAVGVQSGNLTSAIDQRLFESLVTSATELGYASQLNGYFQLTDQYFGSVSGDNTLSEFISGLETALSQWAVDPSSSSYQYDTVQKMAAMVDGLHSLSSSIQSQRADADEDIEKTVGSINELLSDIDDLNEQINVAKAVGSPTADLEDQRNTALLKLSEKMDVAHFTDSNGRLNVYTKSGTALVTSNAHLLSYTATTSVTASVTYPGGFDDISVAGKNITEEIRGGELGALVDLRDQELPALQAELDELATGLISAVNEIANQGSAYPAPNNLSGTETVTAADPFSGTGTVRIAVTASDGTVSGFSDINLGALATVQDVIDEINLIPGASASVNADGVLEITATGATDGIAINQMTSDVGGESFSGYFGLNDIFTGTDASSLQLNSSLTADPGRLPGGRLSDDAGLAVGDIGISSGDASNAQTLTNLFSTDQSFAAAGNLGAKSSSFAEYASSIQSAMSLSVSDAASDKSLKTTLFGDLADTMSSETGVNLDEEIARMNTYQQSYEAGAYVLKSVQELFDTLLNSVS